MKNTCVEKIVINGAEKNITGQFEYDIKHKNIKKNIVLFLSLIHISEPTRP